MPRKHGSIHSYESCRLLLQQHFVTVPPTLLWDNCKLSSARLPGWSRTRGSSIISLLYWGTKSHWLPIRQRIEFKIAVFVHNAVHGRGSTYLSRICNPEASFRGAGGPSPPPQGKIKKKKKKKKRKKRKKRETKREKKKGTMNSVKLLHIKRCFFQFFNSPGGIEK